ncbi:MAG: hypothetical protein HY819_10475 [Acidobacteria bacterium]|nr:hypothetical protein [Acidobacteriota bacterium]
MDEEVLEKLLTKLIGLTEFGALKWHFAGDVSKAYVTVFRDSRLKLTENALDITQLEGETVRLDTKLHQEPLPTLLDNLHKAAKESSKRFRTSAVKMVSSNSLTNVCQKLLEDEEQVALSRCLTCNLAFDPSRSYNHISHKEANGKGFYICQECVSKIGLAEAQGRLEKAVRSYVNSNINNDPITGDTLPGLTKKSFEAEEKNNSESRSI